MGWAMGMNLLVLGVLFSHQLGDAMAPVFIILLALSMIVTEHPLNLSRFSLEVYY